MIQQKEIGTVEPDWQDGWSETSSFILGALQKYAGNPEYEESLMWYIGKLAITRAKNIETAFNTTRDDI